MDSDNVYPNTSWNPLREPEASKLARAEEKANESTVPQVERAVAILKSHVESFDKLPSIPSDVLQLDDEKSTALKVQLAINMGVQAALKPILQELEDVLAQHKR